MIAEVREPAAPRPAADTPPPPPAASPPAAIRPATVRKADLLIAGHFASIPHRILTRPDLSSTAKLLYAVLLDHLRNGDVEIWPSIPRLARQLAVNRATIIVGIATLERAGVLTADHQQGRSTRYRFAPLATADDPSEKPTGREFRPVGKPDCTGRETRPLPVGKPDLTHCIETLKEALPPLPPADGAPDFALTPTEDRKPTARAQTQGGNGKQKAKTKPKGKTDPRVKDALIIFGSEFLRARGRQYIVAPGKDGALVKRLLAAIDHLGEDPADTLESFRAATVAMLADPWGGPRASVGLLSSEINRWLEATPPALDAGAPTPEVAAALIAEAMAEQKADAAADAMAAAVEAHA